MTLAILVPPARAMVQMWASSRSTCLKLSFTVKGKLEGSPVARVYSPCRRTKSLHLRLRLLPLSFANTLRLMFEDENAFLVAHHDIRQFLVGDIACGHLRPDAGIAVDQVSAEFS